MKMNQNKEEGLTWGHSPGQCQREFGILPSVLGATLKLTMGS